MSNIVSRVQQLDMYRRRPAMSILNVLSVDSASVIPHLLTYFAASPEATQAEISVMHDFNYLRVQGDEVKPEVLHDLGLPAFDSSISGPLDWLADASLNRPQGLQDFFFRKWIGIGAVVAFTDICLLDISVAGSVYRQMFRQGIAVGDAQGVTIEGRQNSEYPYFSLHYSLNPRLFQRTATTADELRYAIELVETQGLLPCLDPVAMQVIHPAFYQMVFQLP
jgi:hypothetical protein